VTEILLDRSRIVARQECPRLRYLNYHYGGTGLERVQMALPLVNGIFIHEALSRVLLGQDVDAVIAEVIAAYRAEVAERGVQAVELNKHFVEEQCALVAGLVKGWVLTRRDAILEEYEIVAVEEEVKWELAPGLIQMLRCDGILRRKDDGLLFILEFKTVSYPGYEWSQQWENNIQLMSYTLAVSEVFGEPCGGVIIEGLVKGTRRIETAQSSPWTGLKIQSSPFCYGYKNAATEEVSFEWQRGKNWEKTTSWDYDGDWIAEMQNAGILANQFISLPPICPLPQQTARWRRQTIAAETRYAMSLRELEGIVDESVREQLMDFHFPQHDNACRRYGGSCAFMEFCFNDVVAEDPLASGLYQARVPHHTTELEAE
jgi:hypothetical protein